MCYNEYVPVFSLLSVYLKIRGKRVFLDVEGLLPGEFDKHILTTIARSKSFILVLSPKTLDRCLDDHQCKDWVHKVRFTPYCAYFLIFM